MKLWQSGKKECDALHKKIWSLEPGESEDRGKDTKEVKALDEQEIKREIEKEMAEMIEG